jgi:hypothetical protein
MSASLTCTQQTSFQVSGELFWGAGAGSIVPVRARWLSKRALWLTLAMVVFVPACAVAAKWQITRASDGNDLSYVYSVMWPIFGLLVIYFWWMLIHTDFDTVGLRGMQNRANHQQLPPPVDPVVQPEPSLLSTVDVDPELAAYNKRLAALSERGAKTWRNTETVVARRAQ